MTTAPPLRTLYAPLNNLYPHMRLSTQPTPKGFEKLFDVELPDKGPGGKQVESHKVSRLKARFLKFVIGAGYADFATVFQVQAYSEGV